MEVMTCSKCGVEKPVDAFSWRDKRRNRRHKQCHTSYRRAHYLENREKYLEKANSWNQLNGDSIHIRRELARQYILEYLSTHPCVDCGETDIVVLEFDHVRGDRVNHVSRLLSNGVSVDKIAAEIAKCEVRCANCHRRKTARQNSTWTLRYKQGDTNAQT